MEPLLLLVHVEEQFRRHFRRMYVQRVCQAAKRYQTVHFTSEIDVDGKVISELEPYVGCEIQWAWGDEPDMYEGEERRWVIPSPSPHQWTWIPPAIRALKGTKRPILLGGGYEGECLLNMETCLDYFDIQYKKVPGYVYGA